MPWSILNGSWFFRLSALPSFSENHEFKRKLSQEKQGWFQGNDRILVETNFKNTMPAGGGPTCPIKLLFMFSPDSFGNEQFGWRVLQFKLFWCRMVPCVLTCLHWTDTYGETYGYWLKTIWAVSTSPNVCGSACSGPVHTKLDEVVEPGNKNLLPEQKLSKNLEVFMVHQAVDTSGHGHMRLWTQGHIGLWTHEVDVCFVYSNKIKHTPCEARAREERCLFVRWHLFKRQLAEVTCCGTERCSLALSCSADSSVAVLHFSLHIQPLCNWCWRKYVCVTISVASCGL